MILAHIMANNQEQAIDIIHLLMDKKLLLQAAISEKIIFQKKTGSGKLVSEKRILIIGKTKALLFSTINELLKTTFKDSMPMLYAVPIIYMDDSLAHLLRKNTANI
jgi:uncharacterized protein involved in tolerance to divalent cations